MKQHTEDFYKIQFDFPSADVVHVVMWVFKVIDENGCDRWWLHACGRTARSASQAPAHIGEQAVHRKHVYLSTSAESQGANMDCISLRAQIGRKQLIKWYEIMTSKQANGFMK